MIKQKSPSRRILAFILLIWLILWLALINPHNSQPVVLLAPIILISILIYNFCIWVASQIGVTSNSNRYRAISWLISLIVGVTIVLSSLGELDARDGLVLVAITIIGLIYVTKLMPVRPLDN